MGLSDAWKAYHMGPLRGVGIVRDPSTPLGTFGKLTAGVFYCYTLELADHGNKPGESCIPAGVYRCVMRDSPKFGKCYEVKDVPGRTDILLHRGNFAADEGFGKSDIDGCILLGNAIGEIGGQRALLSSKDAMARFQNEMDGEPFELTIRCRASI